MSLTTPTSPAASRGKHNGVDAAPIDFDPADHPIIARHVFGVSPFPRSAKPRPESPRI